MLVPENWTEKDFSNAIKVLDQERTTTQRREMRAKKKKELSVTRRT